jgi:TrmH family RNA methyltransferase
MNHINIILENPKYSGNLGMICRLLANFSLPPLRIIGTYSQDEPEMLWMAHGAEDEIPKIITYPDFYSATKDLDLVVGTGMIKGHDRGRYLPFEETPRFVKNFEHPIGILFGREDSGLSKESVIGCDRMIDFELPGYQPSMNLANSVAFLLGAIHTTRSKDFDSSTPPPVINKKRFLELSKDVFGKLELNDFHGSENLTWKRWNLILEKSHINQGDLNFLFKIFQRIKDVISKSSEKA